MIRHLKIARDGAVKSRSQAKIRLKTLIINAPAELRDTLDLIKGPISLIRHITVLRPGKITSPIASAKAATHAIARRWQVLHKEIQAHGNELERIVSEKAPGLMRSHGISTMTAAEMLILVGNNPERIRSEATLAKLCGVCPIPASSGKTNRMRLNRVVTDKPMLPSISSHSLECGFMKPQKTMRSNTPLRAKASARLLGA